MKWIGKHPVFSDLLIGGVLLTPPDNQYSYELTLPNDDGTSGQVLTTDGNGVLTWVTNSAGGTGVSMTNGVDNRIMTATAAQAITGEADLTFDASTELLTVGEIQMRGPGGGASFTYNGQTYASYIQMPSSEGLSDTSTGGIIKVADGSGSVHGATLVIEGGDAAGTNMPGGDIYFNLGAHTGSGTPGNFHFHGSATTEIAKIYDTGLRLPIADQAIVFEGGSYDTTFKAATSAGADRTIALPDASGTVSLSDTTYTAGDGLDLSGTTFSTDLKSNGGLVIESTELAVDLGASSITGVLADGDVAQDLTIVAGTINNTPIGASTANTIAGTTIDASTDFTVGTTVITDDQIQFTPSAGDTVTMLAGNNGAFNITCTDASGAKQANLLITADGTAEIAAPGDITLDSALDIELEPGAADKYVNNVGIFRGGNIGPISDTFIPVMPVEFGFSDSYRNPGQMLLNGRIMAPSADRNLYYAQKIIPKGYTASACVLSGVDADGDARFICYQGDVSGTTPAAVSSSTAINSTATFTANIVGDGLKYCTIEFDPGDTTDTLYGAKITIAKT